MKDRITGYFEEAYNKSKSHTFTSEDWVTPTWEQIATLNADVDKQLMTGIPYDRFKELGNNISKLPKTAEFHRMVRKIFSQREKSINEGKDIDWGTAEALAFGSLIQDGSQVRISGQDVERGTFSHRHAHVFYQDRDGYYNPINNAIPQGEMRKFIASNSHLSEFAVLGYELGYSMSNPNSLVLWEA